MGLVVAYFVFDASRYLNIASLKDAQHWFDGVYCENPAMITLAFVTIFAAITAVSLPGAAVMMLAAGASFGLIWGTMLSTFASALGATFAMLATRYLFRDAAAMRLGDRLKALDDGVAKDGMYYLVSLRLAPVIPFFVLNWLIGLTHMRVWPFFWTSFVGMLAGTAVYVNAGTQLSAINSFTDIFSPAIIASLMLLAIVPWLLRAVVRYIAQRDKSARASTRAKSLAKADGAAAKAVTE